MHKKIITVLAIISSFTLAACSSPKKDYTYLMTHPKVLEQDVITCQNTAGMNCDEVARAANDFAVLLNQRRDNPEGFGKSIMQVEYQLSLIKNQLAKATIGSSEAKQLQTEYDEKSQEVKVYLAVVGATSGIG